MKTILMTAYAVNPYKGSEDGMGWNFILQAATHNKIIAYTRKNNKTHIQNYISSNTDIRFENITFKYFDWPKWMIFWKKGPTLSLIYYYFWQLTLAINILVARQQCDIVHNLNFHNDWTPSFLWITRKPLVWGPVGHHPKIESKYLKFYGHKAWLMDRFLWILKNVFWKADPFLFLTKKNAAHILCMNNDAAAKLKLNSNKYSICPSVATDDAALQHISKNKFTIISAGRFVALKGFDITIKSFAAFYNSLNTNDKKMATLHLVGSGSLEKKLKELAFNLGVANNVIFTNWIERNDLQILFASASVFFFPSYEGAGMVVAEAMSHSLPVLCWNNSGPGEFVHINSKLKVNLNLNENEAVQQFSENLNLLFSDSNFYNYEKSLSRQQFEAKFQWQNRGEHFNNIYNSLLK